MVLSTGPSDVGGVLILTFGLGSFVSYLGLTGNRPPSHTPRQVPKPIQILHHQSLRLHHQSLRLHPSSLLRIHRVRFIRLLSRATWFLRRIPFGLLCLHCDCGLNSYSRVPRSLLWCLHKDNILSSHHVSKFDHLVSYMNFCIHTSQKGDSQ